MRFAGPVWVKTLDGGSFLCCGVRAVYHRSGDDYDREIVLDVVNGKEQGLVRQQDGKPNDEQFDQLLDGIVEAFMKGVSNVNANDFLKDKLSEKLRRSRRLGTERAEQGDYPPFFSSEHTEENADDRLLPHSST